MPASAVPAGRDRAPSAVGRAVLSGAAIRPALARAALLAIWAAAGGSAAPAFAASPPAVESDRFMVVAAQRLAAEAGADMLRQGGNAIDAAVAVAYAEAVTNPCCGNLGGGGFLTARLADGRTVFLNFRETAPAASTRTMYQAADGTVPAGASLNGWRAVAVPGSVLGLDTALARWGTLPRERVMAPAIRLAREGFVLTRGDTDIIARAASRLRRDTATAAIFLRPDGSAPRPGDRLVQPALAATLAAIADRGPAAFYEGALPKAAEAASDAANGILTAADFAAYRVTEAPPVACTYRGYAILSAPPPSSGGTALCELLGVLEGYDLRAMGFHGADAVHVMVEAMRHVYADRNTKLGDPAFVDNPVADLLSPAHAAEIRARIAAGTQGSAAPQAPEKTETTHLSVVDAAGNAVALTTTLNGAFGAGVVAPGTGVLMNDEMDDFTTAPGRPNMFGLVQGEANAIAPGKRPLSSMTPTIVLRDGHLVAVLGSPGGSRIITTVLETILNLVDHGMAPQEAVDAPRLHDQGQPDVLFAEPRALSPDTRQRLEAMGYHIRINPPWGAVALVAVGQAQAPAAMQAIPDSAASGATRPGLLYGAMDSRRPAGAAIGR